jgi:hypothetical protein
VQCTRSRFGKGRHPITVGRGDTQRFAIRK